MKQHDTNETELFDLGIGATLDAFDRTGENRVLGQELDFKHGGQTGDDGRKFGLRTGAFRSERSGRFVDGRAPERYDGSADRFRDKPSGEFDPTPDPVERRRHGLFDYADDLEGFEL